jgi:F0F1-type ATP synthase membrane subunit a
MVTGWIVVSFFTMFVGLSMAEIVSAIPTRFDAQSRIIQIYLFVYLTNHYPQRRTVFLGRYTRSA